MVSHYATRHPAYPVPARRAAVLLLLAAFTGSGVSQQRLGRPAAPAGNGGGQFNSQRSVPYSPQRSVPYSTQRSVPYDAPRSAPYNTQRSLPNTSPYAPAGRGMMTQPNAGMAPRGYMGGGSPAGYAQQGPQQPAANPNANGARNSQANGATIGPRANPAPKGAHLGQWMQQHQNLSVQDQQRALQKEPGFSQLPQQTQQNMMQRLNRLNSMPEQQRDRVIQRGEAMERLSPQQRQSVRGAMGQLGALQQDREKAVARSFRELRSMDPSQRNQLLESPEYRQRFSDQERGILNNLLSVSPLLPPSR